jgi:plastocyanin
MIKRIVIILLLCSAATMVFVACGGTSTSGSTITPTSTTGSTTDNTGTNRSRNEVHMSYQTFVQPSMTISKGSKVILVDDVAVPHHIANDTWDDNTAKPMKEAHAPLVDVQLTGQDKQVIGPFNAAGTFHLYCTIHPSMNLTVIVQ